MKQKYKVTETRFISGMMYNKADIISLTPEEAKYYIEPYGEGLELSSASSQKITMDNSNADKKTKE